VSSGGAPFAGKIIEHEGDEGKDAIDHKWDPVDQGSGLTNPNLQAKLVLVLVMVSVCSPRML